MNNEILYDSKGNPDIMVAFTPDELRLAAELHGRTVEAYLISKYPATLIDDVPYSMPYQQPAVNVTLDEAIELCEGKGDGWHLLTNDEWSAIALWCLKNGTMPRGNTGYGRSHSHQDDSGAYAGVFCVYGSHARSSSVANIGFRSAFIRYSGGSGNLDNLTETKGAEHETI